MAEPHQGGKPVIFVTGASRSGTTMLASILGKSQGTVALNELHFFGDLLPIEQFSRKIPSSRASQVVAMTLARHARDFWVDGPNEEERAAADRVVAGITEEVTGGSLFRATMNHIATECDADRLCEQTPRNVYYAQTYLDNYPDATVVHVVRDPRGVLASQKNRYKMRKLGGRGVPFREIIRLWFNYHPTSMMRLWLSATREAERLSSHDRFFTVRYEDLVTTPESTVGKLCDQLGLDFSSDMLSIPHYGSSTVQHSAKGGLSTAALEKWRSVLGTSEIRYCDHRSRDERKQWSYPDCDDARWTVLGALLFALRLPLHVLGVALANPKRMLVLLKALAARR